jgi:hypothetical protein
LQATLLKYVEYFEPRQLTSLNARVRALVGVSCLRNEAHHTVFHIAEALQVLAPLTGHPSGVHLAFDDDVVGPRAKDLDIRSTNPWVNVLDLDCG